MQVRAEQLAGHLAKGLRPIYTVWGDEPLLAQEAGDAIRAAARAAGCSERQVHTVSGAHFDWSGLLGASLARSLFAERQLIEIRIPSGKPGKDGSDALQRYCADLGDADVTLLQLPRLDRAQQTSAWFGALDRAGVTVRIDPIERHALPAWLAQRLARQRQSVAPGEAGQRTLAFFADRVEGNLLAAHQELQKFALLLPPGEIAFEQVEAAVLDVARYGIDQLVETMLAGQVARALRMLDRLEAEGEAAPFVHWKIADTLRALRRVRQALDAGRPMPMALREARVWGARERLFERIVPGLSEPEAAALIEAAQICDGICKGLPHPLWPDEPWPALQRLVLLTLERTANAAAAAAPAARHGRDAPPHPQTRLALRP